MITDAGKELIAKYLLGQVPAYASFISFGCGADLSDTAQPPADKQGMDFELVRVPISSRSYLVDADRNVISLVGQFPFDEGMKVNEIAIWSDATNALARSNSRMVTAFTEKENWMQLDTENNTRTEIPYYVDPLSGATVGGDDSGTIAISDTVFSCSNQNQSLLVGERAGHGTRFLEHTIMMTGQSTIFVDGKGVDLPDYSSSDELKFAFAFYPKIRTGDGPVNATVRLKFMKDPTFAESGATWEETASWDLYNVKTIPLGSISYDPNFSWSQVKWIQIEIDVAGDWYFAPDALRFDNVSTLNPLYRMTGYTKLQDNFIEHKSGTNSYAQFRFELGAD